MKKTIRLTEGDLHRIVRESVNTILNEVTFGKYNNSIDTARSNARAKHSRVAMGKFPDNPEEQDRYVNGKMAGFEERVNKLGDLYNSYGGREKPNAPQYDFRLNGPARYQKADTNNRDYARREGFTPQRAGGVTLRGDEGNIRYFPGRSFSQTVRGNLSDLSYAIPSIDDLPSKNWDTDRKGHYIFNDKDKRLDGTYRMNPSDEFGDLDGMKPSDKKAINNVITKGMGYSPLR